MTDDELWEWMQRDLDKDLSPEEQKVLYTVLDKEPLLKQKYDRLQQVSQRLAELPPVTPPFSIVDSILPKLESAASTPAAQAAESRSIVSTTEVKRVLAPSTAVSKRRSVFTRLARVGSIGVAACLMIGILIMSDDASKRGEDVTHSGTTVSPPVSEPTMIYGPPVPPPSTDSTPTSIPVEEKTVEQKPVKQATPPKKEQQAPAQKPAQTPPPAATEKKVDPTEPLPPVIPPQPPVPREQKPPAFPIGLEEKSDDDKGRGVDKKEDNLAKEEKVEKNEKKQEKEEEKESKRKDKDD
jgi:hypothetical protein